MMFYCFTCFFTHQFLVGSKYACVNFLSTATCGGLQGDVIFVLDSSGSVGCSNFYTMLTFVSDMVNDFDIGSDLVRVGVIKYDWNIYLEIDLNSYTDKTLLRAAILNIAYTGGATNTGYFFPSLS